MGHKNTNIILLNCKNKENTILLLDAFDEDHNAISNHVERLFDIFVICSDFYKVIITCRTQLFYDDDEIPSETNIKRHGPQSASDKGIYGVLRYYIYPFNDKEVRRYFNKYYFFWSIRKKQRAKKIAKSIPYLSARPMLLTHIPDIMNYNSSIETLSDLYDVMFKAWVDRENYWVEKEELIGLSNKLAIDIYNNSDLRGMEKIPHNEIEQVTKALFINLNKWQITSRSLLNRDSEGNYKFSHRSIMEYLYVKNFLSGNSECEGRILTDQMKIFAIDSLSVHDARIAELKDFLMLVNVKIGYFKLGEIYPVMHDYDEYSHNLINRLMGLTCTNYRIDNEEKKHVIREFIIDDSNNKFQFLSDTVWEKKKYYLSLRFAKSYYRFGDDHITIWPLNCEVEIDKKDMSKIMSSMKYLRELVGVIANSKNKRILSRYGFDIYKKIIDINRSEYIQVIPELPYFNDVILLIRKDN